MWYENTCNVHWSQSHEYCKHFTEGNAKIQREVSENKDVNFFTLQVHGFLNSICGLLEGPWKSGEEC